MKTLRTFSLILSLCLAMSANAYDVCIDGIYYNLVTKAKQAQVTNDGDNSYSGDIVIPEKITSGGVEYSVTTIVDRAFGFCFSLTSIQIPCSVVSIGDDAFSSCSSLASIQIPNSVTAIGVSTFAGCTSLTSIQIPNSVTYIGGYAFGGCNSLTSIQIPNTVTYIGYGAFYICTSLTSIQIPNSVTYIDHDAFWGCTSLTSIQIPNSVTYIGYEAFGGCNSLTSIQIPNSVTSISFNAFAGCKNLTSVILGSGIQSIGDHTFADCPNLENVYCNAANPPLVESNAFENSYIEYVNLYVPAESVGKYRNTYPWSSFGNISALTPVNPENIDLVDGENYINTIEKPCSTLTYTRNFTNTDWNALYVPFSMQYDDWSDDFEVARLNDVHQFDDNEDGEIDRTVLEVVKMKEGSMTEPNTPYMIKAKEAGEKTITLTDATLYATDEKSFDVTSWYTKFTFTGTYSTVTDMATRGHYALANGGLKQASSDAATLGAFRWYLDITDRNGNPIPLAGKKVFLSFDDGETTELKFVEANDDSNYAPVYSISGVNVGNDKASLPKGLYISNGKKFVIK